MNYKVDFIMNLQEALGYEPDREMIEEEDWGALAVLCNHASVRINRLQAQLDGEWQPSRNNKATVCDQCEELSWHSNCKNCITHCDCSLQMSC